MGHGLDVCMGDPREARTIEECLESEFVRTLVCQAGLVISGHKPAAVFGFTPRAWRGGDHRQKRALSARLLATDAASTRRYGLCLAGLSRHADGLMLLAWRPSQVEKIVADAQSRAFLDSVGLPSTDASALMGELVGRLRAYYAGRASFPHELGLVLVTAKIITLRPGCLVEARKAVWEVLVPHELDPYKNEYEIGRRVDL